MTDSELDEIADDLTKPVVLIVQLVAAGMLFVTGLMLFFGDASAFQRLGSLWVAILILLFGLTRSVVRSMQLVAMNPDSVSKFTFYGSSNPLVRWSSPKKTLVEELRTREGRYVFAEIVERVEVRLSSRAYPTEFLWLCLATIQWGYGDLFHCWFNGNGWTTC